MIQVKLGLDGTVREVYHRWPTNLVPREAATRDLAAAWSDVVAGGGYLEVDQTIPQDLPAEYRLQGECGRRSRWQSAGHPAAMARRTICFRSTSSRGR